MEKNRIIFLASICTLFVVALVNMSSCETNEGKIVNGNGTVSVGLTYFKDQTAATASRVHHFIQNLDLETYTELTELQEDKRVDKGRTPNDLKSDSPLLYGFTPAGLAMEKDADGLNAVTIFYNRNAVSLTFYLLDGEDSEGHNSTTIKGHFEEPLDVKKDVDLGDSFFRDHNFGPKFFPAVDTEYELNVATISNYVEEKDIEGGTFTRTVNGKTYTVTVNDFQLAAFELPQYLLEQIIGNPSHFQGKLRVPVEGENQDFRPVENLNWFDCLVICNKFSRIDGLIPVYSIDGETDPEKWGKVPDDFDSEDLDKWNSVIMNINANGYRLPTEAEWEYAARGGKLSRSKTNESQGDYIFAGSNNPSEVSWFVENSAACTHEVGKLEPNELGLYDMSGNVSEWCWDIYAPYPESDVENPHGAESGIYRVKRGGAYYNPAEGINSAASVSARDQNSAYKRTSGFGLRLARNAHPMGLAVE